MDAAIEARRIRKVFGSGALAFEALKGVNFHAAPGEFVILAGPSGSGKTTLLSIMGCVLTATDGDLCLMGRQISGLSARQLPGIRMQSIGFIFQGHNLLPSLTAQQNVSFVLQMKGRSRRAAKHEAHRLLERVGLGAKVDSLPSELSGGQRQRVAIARALAGRPPIILADEPTAALDAASGLQATELLREVCRERGDTVVVVTHDNRIFHLADRIVHIEDGEIDPHYQMPTEEAGMRAAETGLQP